MRQLAFGPKIPSFNSRRTNILLMLSAWRRCGVGLTSGRAGREEWEEGTGLDNRGLDPGTILHSTPPYHALILALYCTALHQTMH